MRSTSQAAITRTTSGRSICPTVHQPFTRRSTLNRMEHMAGKTIYGRIASISVSTAATLHSYGQLYTKINKLEYNNGKTRLFSLEYYEMISDVFMALFLVSVTLVAPTSRITTPFQVIQSACCSPSKNLICYNQTRYG